MTALTQQNADGVLTYLDVAAVRIQAYLGRSRHLWGRRGASAVLTEMSKTTEIERLAAIWSTELGTTVTPNAEAPEVDGVISLTLADPASAERVATTVAKWLSAVLPGIHLVARLSGGMGYVRSRATEGAVTPILEWLPAQLEYPPTRLCKECGQDAAVATLQIGDQQLPACADCAARRTWTEHEWSVRQGPTRRPAVVRRNLAGGGKPDQWVDLGTFTVENRLLDAFGVEAAVGDFAELAALGRHRQGNHLATVAADGNALGVFFKAAERTVTEREQRGEATPEDRTVLASLSQAVAATTWDALRVATSAVFDASAGEPLPVIPHVLGGDDVLVSVTADRAWRFVRHLLTGFTSTADGSPSLLAAAATQLRLPPPTLSAGVVISHASLPFGQQVSLAGELLEQAKHAVRGQEHSVTWLDTTSEGTSPLPDRRALTLEQLSRWAPGLDQLTGIPASAQHALLREVDTADPVLAQQRVRGRLRRQEPAVVDAVLAFLDAAGDSLLAEESNAEECVRALRGGLSLARWWR